MTKRTALVIAISSIGILLTASCHRSNTQTATVKIPQMITAQEVRIVTNAALHEVVGNYDGIPNRCEVDLSKKWVLYHEGPQLLKPAYQTRIKSCLAEVGFKGHVMSVQYNPPVRITQGMVEGWVDRHTMVISIPDMMSNTDANIVVDAIAYARLGADDPRVSVDANARCVVAQYNRLFLARKNIEYAIAGVGFDANTVPAYLGEKNSIAHGWSPIQL